MRPPPRLYVHQPTPVDCHSRPSSPFAPFAASHFSMSVTTRLFRRGNLEHHQNLLKKRHMNMRADHLRQRGLSEVSSLLCPARLLELKFSSERIAEAWATPTKWYPIPVALGALVLLGVQYTKQTRDSLEVERHTEQGAVVRSRKVDGPWQVRRSSSPHSACN